jgi:hypothetical protein
MSARRYPRGRKPSWYFSAGRFRDGERSFAATHRGVGVAPKAVTQGNYDRRGCDAK